MTGKPVLVIASANAEWRSLLQIKQPARLESGPYGDWFIERDMVDVIYMHGGWGKISAAASAEFAINRWSPGLVMNLGTCGGFRGMVNVGEIILAEETVVYDIVEQMGDQDEATGFYSSKIDCSWLPDKLPLPARRARLVSADRDILPQDIPWLAQKYGAVAADWESGAIAWVAQRHALPCLILRGVTDLVGTEGGDAYGMLELFQERSAAVMKTLLGSLQDWIKYINGNHPGAGAS